MSDKKQLIAQFSWAMAGKFPEIPTKEGVDIEALTQGDGDPTFVTLPIAVAGGVASDGFKYTEDFVNHMLQTILSETVTGHMGHLSPFSRSTEFPVPDAFWVGADMKGGKLWAKAYIRNKDVASYVRQLKATNATIATSIYGTYDNDGVTSHLDGSWSVKSDYFDLEHVDFAPPKRAALDIPGRDMEVTRHIDDETNKGNEMPNELEFLAQLTPDKLPASLTAQIHNPADAEVIAQLEKSGEDQKVVISQLNMEVSALKNELFTRRIDALVHTSVKVDAPALRDYVSTKVLAQAKPEATPEELAKFVEDVVASEAYTQLATGIVMNLSGGKPFTTTRPAGTESEKSIADKTMEKLDAIKARVGVE